jgi:hypothetical protein
MYPSAMATKKASLRILTLGSCWQEHSGTTSRAWIA